MCKLLSLSHKATFVKAILAPILLFLMGGGILNSLYGKESANWIFGVGFGYGATQIDEKYPESTRNKLGIPVGGGQHTWLGNFNEGKNTSAKSWGINYEILVGYKHFVNDYIGFRYYANVGAQNYKDAVFSNNKNTIGVIEYTANADLLINFYNDPIFSFGILGGFGVGGASFDSAVLKKYESDWGASIDSKLNEPMYKGIGEVYRHHFSASISVGVRFNFFQQLRAANQLVCNLGGDGRRSCGKPITTLEHSIEANAKFPLLTYYATKAGDLVAMRAPNQANLLRGVSNRPGYEIKNPYKFTLRYIIAF